MDVNADRIEDDAISSNMAGMLNETIKNGQKMADRASAAQPGGSDVAGRALDPLELWIVAALHLNPRASWGLLARALKTSEATVARHAQQLLSNGDLAVVGTLERPWDASCSASVLVTCRAGRMNPVADALTEDDHVRFVGVTSPTRCVIEVVAPDHRSMLTLLDERLPRIEGVLDISCDLLLHTFTGAHAWDPKILPPQVVSQLTQAPPTAGDGGYSLDEQDIAIVAELRNNGRMSIADLGRATGLSQSTARRRLHALVSRGILHFRTIVEPSLIGFEIELAFWLTMEEPSRLSSSATELAAHPAVRYLVATTGRHALFGTAVLRDVNDVFPFMTDVLGKTPGLRDVEMHPLLLVRKRHWNQVRR